MIDVRKEKDTERLRQVAVLLEQENEKLHKRLAALAAQVDELKGQDARTLQQEIDALEAELTTSGAASPGTNKSERRRRKRRPKKDPKERTDFGTTDQPKLETEESLLTMPEEDRTCPECGGVHGELAGQFEESEHIDVVQRTFKVIKQKRQKYVVACDCEPDASQIFTTPQSPVSERATLGGRYSIRFLAMVAVLKYVDHMPLNRQAAQFGREGLTVKANTLFNGLWSIGQHTSATVDAIQDEILTSGCVHIDETGWPGLDAKGATRELWSIVSKKGVYYRVLPNRSYEGAMTMLKSYTGWVLSDGLRVYDKAARELHYRQAGCWSHARRKFVDCEDDFCEATLILDLIDEMFLIERQITDELNALDTDDEAARLAYRKQERGERIKPVFDKLFIEVAKIPALKTTKLGEAIRYMVNLKAKLRVFLEHPEVPMTNNDAELALRAGVIGRKNFNGTRSRRGEVITGMMYTLCGTAKLYGIEPAEYIEAVVRHELANPGSPLLPQDYLNQRVN